MPFCPPRVPGFSYQGFYQYFVTACTSNRRPLFLEPSHAQQTTAHFSPFFQRYDFDVLAYCLMPDHVHLLLEGTSPTSDFREAMRQWKQQTARAWKAQTGQRLWQAGYYERVLREGEDTRDIVAYVLNNPVRAGLVATFTEWPWIGSSIYSVADLAAHVGHWRPSWK
jgi:putative transposase